jgi:hypothetical protein
VNICCEDKHSYLDPDHQVLVTNPNTNDCLNSVYPQYSNKSKYKRLSSQHIFAVS